MSTKNSDADDNPYVAAYAAHYSIGETTEELQNFRKTIGFFSGPRPTLKEILLRDAPADFDNWPYLEQSSFLMKALARRRREQDERYDDTHVRVSNLLRWWWKDMSEETLRARVIPEIPLYELVDDEFVLMNYVPAPLTAWELKWWDSREKDTSEGWWATRIDVGFFEALHPELCGVHEDNPWRSPDVVSRDLRIEMNDLVRLCLEHNFPAFRLDRREGVIAAEQSYVQQWNLKDVLFPINRVSDFEAKHPDLCGLRGLSSEEDMIRKFVEYAKGRYAEDDTLSLTDVDREIRNRGMNVFVNEKGERVERYGKNYITQRIRHLWPEHLRTGPKPKSKRK